MRIQDVLNPTTPYPISDLLNMDIYPYLTSQQIFSYIYQNYDFYRDRARKFTLESMQQKPLELIKNREENYKKKLKLSKIEHEYTDELNSDKLDLLLNFVLDRSIPYAQDFFNLITDNLILEGWNPNFCFYYDNQKKFNKLSESLDNSKIRKISLRSYKYNPQSDEFDFLTREELVNYTKIVCQIIAKNLLINEIDLVGNNFNNAEIEQILSALEKNYHIKSINLDDNNITDQNILAKFIKNPNLESLILSSNKIDDEGFIAILKELENNSSLSFLELSHNKISSVDFTKTSFFEKNNKLEDLLLMGNKFDLNSFKGLLKKMADNNSIKYLDIAFVIGVDSRELFNQSIEEFSSMLEKNTALLSINISSNNISQESFNRITSSLKNNFSLTNMRYESDESILQEQRNQIDLILKRNQVIRDYFKDCPYDINNDLYQKITKNLFQVDEKDLAININEMLYGSKEKSSCENFLEPFADFIECLIGVNQELKNNNLHNFLIPQQKLEALKSIKESHLPKRSLEDIAISNLLSPTEPVSKRTRN